MAPFNCSGLVILSKFRLTNQRYVILDQGDATKETDPVFYIDHFAQRKVLYADIRFQVWLPTL